MSGGSMHAAGQRLFIGSCLGQTCEMIVSTSILSGDNCGGGGQLHIDSATTATATLQGSSESRAKCTLVLNLHEENNQRSISIKNQGGDCGYYCTPKCSFERSFPFRSTARFYGDDIPGCFLARSKALLAVCTDKSLADLQRSWMSLLDETSHLTRRSGQSKQIQSDRARDQAQAKCSSSEDPAGCLRAFFKADGERLTSAKAQWQAGVTNPGDADEAARKAKAMEGVYTHAFANETVQGDHFTSTNRLSIKPEPNGVIHFKVDLNFYNGHTCSAEGSAAYKQNGAFVYRSNEIDETCVLEIFAGRNGVEFQDPLGGCKYYCGQRGSLDGAAFPYSERKAAAR